MFAVKAAGVPKLVHNVVLAPTPKVTPRLANGAKNESSSPLGSAVSALRIPKILWKSDVRASRLARAGSKQFRCGTFVRFPSGRDRRKSGFRGIGQEPPGRSK